MINPIIFLALSMLEFHPTLKISVSFKAGDTVLWITQDNGEMLEVTLGLFTNNDPVNIARQILEGCLQCGFKVKRAG